MSKLIYYKQLFGKGAKQILDFSSKLFSTVGNKNLGSVSFFTYSWQKSSFDLQRFRYVPILNALSISFIRTREKFSFIGTRENFTEIAPRNSVDIFRNLFFFARNSDSNNYFLFFLFQYYFSLEY